MMNFGRYLGNLDYGSINENVVQESRKKAFENNTEYNKNSGCNYLYSIILEVV